MPTETRKMSVYFLAGSSSADSLAVGVGGSEDPDGAGVRSGGGIVADMLNSRQVSYLMQGAIASGGL